ncbi:MAG: hypothetical protein EXR62_04555 [Chloroflexi bacterium]|nr:hypothetical protein [Chloroflexota bacterium]
MSTAPAEAAPSAFTRSDLWALMSLAGLTLTLTYSLLFTNRILAGLDVFTYFTPYRAYASEALRAGRFPLWNPDIFMGAPFFANIQSAVLYPLHWPFLWLSPPYQVTWSIALHLFLAGAFTYWFARGSLTLSPAAALVAAILFAAGGYTGAQAEHLNQLNALIWFPLLLHLATQALTHRRRGAALGLVLVIAVQFLAGHTQTSFINLTGLLLWTLAALVPWRRPFPGLRPAALILPLAGSLGLIAWGGALAAGQLLPTVELSRLSIRAGGLPFNQALSFSLDPRLLLRALLPFSGSLFSEYIAYLGILGVALALLGGLHAARWRFGLPLVVLCLVGLALALGAYDPLYWALYYLVPGFSLFRVPARWLEFYALGAALLGGWGFQAIQQRYAGFTSPPRWVIAPLLVAGAALAILAALSPTPPSLNTISNWLMLAAVTGGILALGRHWGSRPGYQMGLVCLLALELWGGSRGLAYTHTTAPQAYTSWRETELVLAQDQASAAQAGRVLSVGQLTWDPGDLGAWQALLQPEIGSQGVYDLVVALKQRELLAPNLTMLSHIPGVDGYDGGLLPLRAWVDLMNSLLPPGKSAADGRLREALPAIPPLPWLDRLGVRYIISDKLHDIWIDNAFYDLAFDLPLQSGESILLAAPRPFPTTALGLISFLSPDAASQETVGAVELRDAQGQTISSTMQTGRETATTDATPSAPQPPKSLPRQSPATGKEYFSRLSLTSTGDGGAGHAGTFQATTIRIQNTLSRGVLHLRGMALLDTVTGEHQTMSLAPPGTLSLIHSGDVKIYRLAQEQPRIFIARSVSYAASSAQALSHLITLDTSDEVVIETALPATSMPDPATAPGAWSIAVQQDAPEAISLQVQSEHGGYLVVRDTFYPGWEVQVDSRPAPALRADGFFRAVYLAPGSHQVTWRYRPLSLTLGAALSLGALLALLGAWPLWVIRRT